MRTFEYSGFDAAGRKTRGLVEADSVKGVRERLAARGILADRVRAAARGIRLPTAARADLYRGLAALLGARVPLLRALEILSEAPEQQLAGAVLAAVRDEVRNGRSLAASLGDASASVSAFECAIIEAAERSAGVDIMLDRLAGFLEQEARVKERVQGALIYPLIVMAAGVCVAVLMLGLLLPRAAGLMEGRGRDLPALTQRLVEVGAFLRRWWWALGSAGLLAGWLGWRRVRRDTALRLRLDRWRFRLPVLGRGYALLVSLRFARTLAILLQGGVAPVEGLRLAGRATGSAWITARADEEAAQVHHGRSLSEAIRSIRPLAGALAGWVQVGEGGGEMDRLLEGAGRRCEEQWDRFLNRGLAVLEPLLIVVVGGFVLLVTLAVLLPVLSLSRTIGR